MSGVDPRAALAALVAERGESLAALSRMLGRNPAYLQQFVQRGSPRRLAERDRRLLAAYFGVPEARLGGEGALVPVRRLDAAVSAGPGALAEDDAARGGDLLDPALLRRLGVRAERLAIVTARGDSMLPGIADGDELLIDEADRQVPAAGALFVIRLDGALLVKRLVPGRGGAIEVRSDNPAWPSRDARPEIIGRVVRLTRRLR